MGVPLMRTKLWAYGVGAAAGGSAAPSTRVAGRCERRHVQLPVLRDRAGMVILGGMANVYGCILGAVILTWVNYTG